MPVDPATAIQVNNLTKVYKARGRGKASVKANDGLNIQVKTPLKKGNPVQNLLK